MKEMDDKDKKTKILQATLKLVTDNGFHGTPVSMIAREAGVGAGTIYRYFSNKEAIINELYDLILKDLYNATMINVPKDVSVKDEFYIKWRNILMYFLAKPYEAKFIQQYSSSPYINPKVVEENNRRNIHLRILIDRGLKNNEIRELNYHTIVVYMWGTIKELYHLHNAGILTISDELISDIFSVFWEGVRKRD